MLTPHNRCIQVTVSINRTTHCFETVIADIHRAGSRFRCVLLAGSKHQREKRAISIPRQSALQENGLRASWIKATIKAVRHYTIEMMNGFSVFTCRLCKNSLSTRDSQQPERQLPHPSG